MKTIASKKPHDQATIADVDARVENLAEMVAHGFAGNDARFAKIEGDIEKLAIMTANGFEDVRREIRGSEDRIIRAIRAAGISMPFPQDPARGRYSSPA